METPSSSTRRVTRSQTLASINNSNVSALQKIEESEKGSMKSRQRNGNQQDRSALLDITNDSPIVGLAMGKLKTPSSNMSKKSVGGRVKQEGTPGSGEALLRGQVKTLLQKVEEEAEISKLSFVPRPSSLHIQGQFFNSPIGLLAPTPANTPQIIFSNPSVNGSENNIGLVSILQVSSEKEVTIPKSEPEKELTITRSLMLDFSESKSEGAYSSEGSSVVTYQGGESEGKDKATTEDDDSSIWSIQVNTSTGDDHDSDVEEEIDDQESENDDYYYFEEEEEEAEEGEDADAELVDELCDAISKIDVNGNGAKFCGKHIKFVYNSDDEIEGEEVFGSESGEFAASNTSPGGALKLKGLPTPKGKHIRFPEEFDV